MAPPAADDFAFATFFAFAFARCCMNSVLLPLAFDHSFLAAVVGEINTVIRLVELAPRRIHAFKAETLALKYLFGDVLT